MYCSDNCLFTIASSALSSLVFLGLGFIAGKVYESEMAKRRSQIWVKHGGQWIKLHSMWEAYTYHYLKDQGYKFIPQPKPALPYRDQHGVLRTYTADFLVWENGTRYLIEVKPRRFYSRRVEHKLKAVSKLHSIKVVVWTERELKRRKIFDYKEKLNGQAK